MQLIWLSTMWLLAGIAIAGEQPATAPATQPDNKPTEQIEIAGERFKLEVSADDQSREKGLSGRNEIAADGGMVFIFPDTAMRSFWMPECVIDIDIVFLDENGLIVSAYEMKAERPQRRFESRAEYEARLKRYSSRKPAQFAIELKAGSIKRLKLKPGQKLDIEIQRLKSLAQ
jgi:uncharacterized membrane protein (UPF0127 family)